MAGKGISINVGVASVAPGCCGSSTLNGAEEDARQMLQIAAKKGFAVGPLLVGVNANADVVRDAMCSAAKELKTGDTLLLTFAGHGCQVRRHAGIPEQDGYEETWCLYDREMLDNELHNMWAKFREGVRILVIADSCHSGGSLLTALMARDLRSLAADWWELRPTIVQRQAGSGWMPPAHLRKLVLPRARADVDIKASVLLIAACREAEAAQDGTPNGLFTSKLLEVWAADAFPFAYPEFIQRIHDRVSSKNPGQHPGVGFYGRPNPAFLRERPFQL